jgi:hypothetical protein
MFCDLVGSTGLSRRLDPEDLREVIGAYRRYVTETIGRFGGFVAKYMGDGVLIYFGYPRAHEGEVERAVRAGLAVIDAIGELQAPERLRARIGIATGLVVVGDLIGEGEARERGIDTEPRCAAASVGRAERPCYRREHASAVGAPSSRSSISGRRRSGASPNRSVPGACSARAAF